MKKHQNNIRESDYEGYTSLYHKIKAKLSEQNILLSTLMIWFAPGYFLINLAFVLALTFLTIQDPFPSIAFGLYLLVLVIFIVLMFATFISLALVGSQNSEQYVKKIVTWLIFTLKTPFQNRFGLNPQELSVIKNIAQSEQGAADWRGTYVNIMVIGAIGFLWGAGTTSTKWFAENLPANFRVQSLFEIQPILDVLLIAIGWSITCIGANIIGAKLLNYLHDFLISEFSNRAIIYACLEAEALFLSQNLEQSEVLTFNHKKSIANILGYTVISSQEKEWKYLSSSTERFSHDDNEKALIDEIEKSKISKKILKEQETPALKLTATKFYSRFSKFYNKLKARLNKNKKR